jgi:PAS domain S-box-containing protein
MISLYAPSSNLLRLRELTDNLELQETVFHFFFEQSPDLLCVINDDGVLCRLNSAWQKILGWTKEELLNRYWLDFVHPDDFQTLREVFELLEERDVGRFCCRIGRRDSHFVMMEFSASRWRDGHSNLIGRPVPSACLNCPAADSRCAWGPDGCDAKQIEPERRRPQ